MHELTGNIANKPVCIPSAWYGCLKPKDNSYIAMSLRYAFARFCRMIIVFSRIWSGHRSVRLFRLAARLILFDLAAASTITIKMTRKFFVGGENAVHTSDIHRRLSLSQAISRWMARYRAWRNWLKLWTLQSLARTLVCSQMVYTLISMSDYIVSCRGRDRPAKLVSPHSGLIREEWSPSCSSECISQRIRSIHWRDQVRFIFKSKFLFPYAWL